MAPGTESRLPLYYPNLRRLLVSWTHLWHTYERVGVLVRLAYDYGGSYL